MANLSTTLSTPFGGEKVPGRVTRTPGIFSRAFAAIMEARQEKADREIAEILAYRGHARPDWPNRAAVQPIPVRARL
jgi:hypothetical protein